MSITKPRVSALVITYNHAHYIADALESIYAQTYQDYEVVVVDDGSTDGTPELMKRWPNARYYYQQNQGLNPALNRAIELAEGEYIAILAADDTWAPRRLEQQVPILEQRPEIGMVYGDAMVVDEHGTPIRRFNEVYPVQPGDFATELFTHYCFVSSQTLLIRRRCFEHLGGFWGPTAISDYLKWIEIGIHYKVVYLNAVMGNYRRHQHNMTRANAGDFKYRSTVIGLEELLDRYPLFRAQLGVRVAQRFSNIYFRNAVHHMMHKEATTARHLFGEALRRRPGYPAALAGLTFSLLTPILGANTVRALYNWRVPYK